jgi:hypothetical protein
MYWFDIITWPGKLCISGDMGCYVFSRLHDMFEFFRHNGINGPDKSLYINDGYWAEKLVSAACTGRYEGKVRRWSSDAFRVKLEERLAQHLQECDLPENEEWSPEMADELREAIEELIDDAGEDQSSAIREACNFDMHGLAFEDAWEWDCTEWDFSFLWCLYAIVWGIGKFDEAQAKLEAA